MQHTYRYKGIKQCRTRYHVGCEWKSRVKRETDEQEARTDT